MCFSRFVFRICEGTWLLAGCAYGFWMLLLVCALGMSGLSLCLSPTLSLMKLSYFWEDILTGS